MRLLFGFPAKALIDFGRAKIGFVAHLGVVFEIQTEVEVF